MHKLFISYARENKPDVEALVRDLDALGHQTWLDSSLRGGQKWWDEILRRIADSDVFVSVVSPHNLNSVACRHELQWATALNKPVLPLAVGPLPDALPRALSTRQITQYSPSSREAAFALAGALANLPPAGPLPSPLPDPPAAPLSYLTDLIDQVAQSEPLSHDQQREVLARLSTEVDSADPEEARGARYVLQTFSQRDDLYADVSHGLAKLGITAAPAAPPVAAAPPAPPAPASSAPARPHPAPAGAGRKVFLGLAAVALLGLAAILAKVLIGGGGGDGGPPPNPDAGTTAAVSPSPGPPSPVPPSPVPPSPVSPDRPASLSGRWVGRAFGDQSLDLVADITDGPPLIATVRYPELGCECTWKQTGSGRDGVRYVKEMVDSGSCVESEVTLVPQDDGTLEFSSTYYSASAQRNLTIHGSLSRTS